MAKRKGWKAWQVVMSVLLIIGGLYLVFGNNKTEKITEISVSSVKNADISEQVSASGKIQPETEVKISPEVSGEIVEVLIKEGDLVTQGQLLARIRPDILRDVVESSKANFNSVKANLAQAQVTLLQRKSEMQRLKIEYERAKKLFDQKITSEIEYLQAKTNYEVSLQQVAATEQSIESARYNTQGSQATLNQQMNNLARTEIYAPTTGTISKLNIEKGEKVVGTAQMAGTEMLRLANLNSMEVEVNVNENDIVKVRPNQKVIIEVDSYLSSNRKFEGIVTEIANTANATASADAVTEFKVKIRILNESYSDLVEKNSNLSPFRPGMTASVNIITQTKKQIPVVPIEAVTTRTDDEVKEMKQDKTQKANTKTEEKKDEKSETKRKIEKPKQYVFVYDKKNNIVSLREVETGISDFENIEITKGLQMGEEVVIAPFNAITKNLKDKDKVKIKENKKTEKK